MEKIEQKYRHPRLQLHPWGRLILDSLANEKNSAEPSGAGSANAKKPHAEPLATVETWKKELA